jgi:hypothetical protein
MRIVGILKRVGTIRRVFYLSRAAYSLTKVLHLEGDGITARRSRGAAGLTSTVWQAFFVMLGLGPSIHEFLLNSKP